MDEYELFFRDTYYSHMDHYSYWNGVENKNQTNRKHSGRNRNHADSGHYLLGSILADISRQVRSNDGKGNDRRNQRCTSIFSAWIPKSESGSTYDKRMLLYSERSPG